MKKITASSTIIILVYFLYGCGAVQKTRYYKASPTGTETETIEWGDGIALNNDGICVWVGDASALYFPLAAGPIGLPIFPLGVLSDTPEKHNYFDLSVWLVPEYGDKNYYFDPGLSIIEFSNGHEEKATSISGIKYSTKWEKEKVYWFTPETIETISGGERISTSSLSEIKGLIGLWDWNRIILRFEKPNKEVSNFRVKVDGIYHKNNKKQALYYKFVETEGTRYVVSGQTANAESMGDTPGKPCRMLQKKRKDT